MPHRRPIHLHGSDLPSINDELILPVGAFAQPATVPITVASRKRGKASGLDLQAPVPRGLNDARTKLLKPGESDLSLPSHIGR